MSTFDLYLIRHEPSGNYLPEPEGRMGRGGSHTEPTPIAEKPPRIFRTERAAKIALNSWLKGKYVRTYGYDSQCGEYWEDTRVVPVPDRVASEMHVVKATVALS